MQYTITISKEANNDLEDIILYFKNNLKNIPAALNFLEKYNLELSRILEFPYANPEYRAKEIINNYRYAKVNNYYLIYKIDEEKKAILISRVFYHKRNMSRILK